jgi:hypothetical protein
VSSNHTITEVTPTILSTTPPAPAAVQRPFVMPQLIKHGKVATLTGDYGASEVMPVDPD